MLRDGPIPRFVHGAIEYVAGVLFIAVPFLLSFDHGSAVATSIVVGVVILTVAAMTDGPTGLSAVIETKLHVVLDFVLAAFLIAAPFVFGFSDEGAPTAWFLILGVAHLLITIGTQFKSAPAV